MSERQPAVAGMFYPGERTTLDETLSLLLDEAAPRALHAKVLIVPHAGYIYSGPIAANAYALLRERRAEISRVVLLGPSHHIPLSGLALPASDHFSTPLGTIPLDTESMNRLGQFGQVQTLDAAHEREHSLEVQLPFLQKCLDNFVLLPIVAGDTSANAVADVLDAVWGGPETLIVISTDLSHYLKYHDAQERDMATVRAIEQLSTHLTGGQACGCFPLNGMMEAARRKGMKVTTLDVRNSGDTAGDHARVVGYGAFALQ